ARCGARRVLARGGAGVVGPAQEAPPAAPPPPILRRSNVGRCLCTGWKRNGRLGPLEEIGVEFYPAAVAAEVAFRPLARVQVARSEARSLRAARSNLRRGGPQRTFFFITALAWQFLPPGERGLPPARPPRARP